MLRGARVGFHAKTLTSAPRRREAEAIGNQTHDRDNRFVWATP